MNESNLPAIGSFLPLGGLTFHTQSACPLADVSVDLCRIASFFQERDTSSKLDCFHDWWEHDGLHFPHGTTDYHRLFQTVGTPRSLIESMTGDHRVFIAFSPQDRTWYLRFFADWNEEDTDLVGEYSVSIAEALVRPFSSGVLPKLRCSTGSGDVVAYFRRIEA